MSATDNDLSRVSDARPGPPKNTLTVNNANAPENKSNTKA